MDFAIKTYGGKADMTWEPVGDISNNIWLSLNIKKGTLFTAEWFGNRFHLVGKNTSEAPALVKAYAEEALQWILDTGRAESIDVTTYQDLERWPSAIFLKGEAVEKSGRQVPFETFVEVV